MLLFRRAAVAISLLVSSTTAFQQAARPTSKSSSSASTSSPASSASKTLSRRQHRSSAAPLWQYEGGDGGNSGSGSGGSILLQADAKSRLFESFAALSMADQYDAVLTGLCAKILDGSDKKNTRTTEADSAVIEALGDPMNLLQEMNQKRIRASPRSIMALIDSTVKTQDAATMSKILSLCRRNGGGTIQYGNQQAEILALPSTPTTRVKCPDGSTKTRQERLQSVPDIPQDDRVQEIASALAVAAIAGACEATNIIGGLEDITPYANLVLGLMIIIGVVDNCYDLLQSASNMLVNQASKDKDNPQLDGMLQNFKMPAKDSLPFGLGTGLATGQVVRGANRLLTMDASREAKVEGAALFAAYALGLPCFAFQANALEAAVLAVESTSHDDDERTNSMNSNMDSLLSDSGILRLLIWLMAPVAMESIKYPVCIMSDPRQASGFLERLESVAAKDAQIAQELWWMDNQQERNDLLKWAYTEADLLLRSNMKTVEKVSQRLEGGAATVGDCVAVLENW